jgi:hypothetical protein
LQCLLAAHKHPPNRAGEAILAVVGHHVARHSLAVATQGTNMTEPNCASVLYTGVAITNWKDKQRGRLALLPMCEFR